MNPDAVSQGMFWAGALMVFTPLVAAGIVIGVWWYQKKKTAGDGEGRRGTAKR